MGFKERFDYWNKQVLIKIADSADTKILENLPANPQLPMGQGSNAFRKGLQKWESP